MKHHLISLVKNPSNCRVLKIVWQWPQNKGILFLDLARVIFILRIRGVKLPSFASLQPAKDHILSAEYRIRTSSHPVRKQTVELNIAANISKSY
jgi:hypothetical protein